MQTDRWVLFRVIVGAAVVMSAVEACGGGGGGGSNQPPGPIPSASAPSYSAGVGTSPLPAPSPSATASGTTVAGSVALIPNDGFGPFVILGYTYAFDSAGSPLSGATVIIGPVPIVGATPPASLPAGDVSTKTTTTGAFSVNVPTPPASPALSEPFVIPTNNITNFTPPSTGYYVEVFGSGTDGLTAGMPLPLHSFRAASTSLALHVTTSTSAESAALAAVNSDRASNAGAGALIFDEAAEEAARLHAYDEANNGYYCHYDLHNVGPSSRYLNNGGVGLVGEAIGLPGSGVTSSSQAFSVTESAILAEKPTSGGHYTNLVDSAHLWSGLAAFADQTLPTFYAVDYELVTPSAVDSVVGSSGYEVLFGAAYAGCPAGTSDNNS